MDIVQQLRSTRVGVWLRNRPDGTVLGVLVRAAWRLNKARIGMALRRRPEHRAHDRAQQATLARFVQDTARAQDAGPDRP